MTEPEKEKPPEKLAEQIKRILERAKDNPLFIAMAREMILRYSRGQQQ